MATPTAEERREALRRRAKTAVQERGQTGLGKKSALDLSLIGDKKIQKYSMGTGKVRNTIDILPFVVTEEWYKDLRTKAGTKTGLDVGFLDYKLEYPVHRGVGEDNDVFLCLRLAFGRKCILCDEMFEEWDKKEEEQDEKRIRALKPSWRNAYSVYNYDEPEKEIQLWDDQSYHLFENMLVEEMETDTDGLTVFSDLQHGMTIQFRAREKSIGSSSFAEAHSLNFISREPYEDSLLEITYPLDKMLSIPTYDEVVKAHLRIDATGAPIPTETRPGQEPEPAASERTTRRSFGRTIPETDAAPERQALGRREPEPKIDGCPAHGEFGLDCNRLKQCASCEEEIFRACATLQDTISRREPPPEPDPVRPRSLPASGRIPHTSPVSTNQPRRTIG